MCWSRDQEGTLCAARKRVCGREQASFDPILDPEVCSCRGDMIRLRFLADMVGWGSGLSSK